LNVFNFGVKNLQTEQTSIILCAQNFAKKGSNEVASILDWYVRTKIGPEVRHIIFFADNSPGQNKNRFVLSIMQNFCNTICETVTVHFPTPGHSFLPIDRDFAVLEKK